MFLLPACQVSAVSSSNTYKPVFSCLLGFFFFHLYLCTHIRHRDSSCRLIFITRSTYYPHSQAENCLKNCFKESPRHSRNLPLCHLNYNHTKCHIICTTPLLKSQESVSPTSLWLAAIHQVFPDRIQAISVSQGFRIFYPPPPLTQRQFRVRSETAAEVIELRKAMMC